jgi:hypothetical protein
VARSANGERGRQARPSHSRRDITQRPDTAIESPRENDGTARERTTGASERSTRATLSDGGAGLSTSGTPSDPSVPAPPTAADSLSTKHGDAAAGGSEAINAGDGRDDAPSGYSVANRKTQTPPPWQSSSWPVARDEALSAVRDGRVPDAYRDLVRTYFAPEPK